MVTTKKTVVYNRRGYYKKRWYRKKWRYLTGVGNYFKCRMDVAGVLSFGPDQGHCFITLGNESNGNWTLDRVLSYCSNYSSLSTMFKERKLRGVKITIVPANDSTVSVSNSICVSYVRSTGLAYGQLVNNNGSLLVNCNQTSTKYIPVINQWTKSQLEVADLGSDGYIVCRSLAEATTTQYPRQYTIKISLYMTLRNLNTI